MTGQLGKPVLRKEDPALLSGRGRYADDLPIPVGTLHAHVIRSPHAHAEIVRIDAAPALAQDGVWAVISGEDVRKLSDPFLAAVKTPVQQWTLAVERVRYVGEPVALVVAESRYLAEDAAERVTVEYQPLEAVLDPPRHPATFTRLAYRRAARAHGRAARLAPPAAKMRPSGARVMAVGLRSEADLVFEPAGL